jgi:predicted MPP superfamily phosphohydrolase
MNRPEPVLNDLVGLSTWLSMALRFVIFLILLSAALGGLSYFVYRRLVSAFALSRRGQIALRVLLIGGLVALVAGRSLRPLLGDGLSGTMSTTGYTIMLAVIVSAAMLMVERVAAGMMRAAKALPWLADPTGSEQPAEIPAAQPAKQPQLGRRELVTRVAVGAAVSVGATSALYGTLFGRHDYALEEVPIRLSALPPALDGFSIVQLSDIHLGTHVGEAEVRAALELVARAKPDLIVLTGDMLDHDHRYAELLGSMTRRLGEHAPVAAIAGNHDYYAGLVPTLGALKRAGAEVLVNRAITIGDSGGRFILAGVDDLWAKRFGAQRGPNVQNALAGADPELAKVLLCHNPAYFAEAAPDVDLQLSGHTHGGQFNLGIRPADYLLPFGYVAGRYQRGEGQLYVNRGFGTAGPPARLGAAPEVTKIILTV